MLKRIPFYFRRPVLLFDRIKQKVTNSIYKVMLRLKGVKFGKNLMINGKPLIDKRNGRIIIGNNVTLDSNNFGYHSMMMASVKLFTDRPSATIIIGDECRIHGACLHAWKKIKLGKRVLVAANCTIIDADGHLTHLLDPKKRISTSDDPREIEISEDVWICQNSIILKGTSIGRGSVVSANSVVKGSFPPFSLISGNPAKMIKNIAPIKE